MFYKGEWIFKSVIMNFFVSLVGGFLSLFVLYSFYLLRVRRLEIGFNIW